MDLACKLFNIDWDGSNRKRESWGRFKRRVAKILRLSSLVKFDYTLYFCFYERKQNKCAHVLHCDIITIKEDC